MEKILAALQAHLATKRSNVFFGYISPYFTMFHTHILTFLDHLGKYRLRHLIYIYLLFFDFIHDLSFKYYCILLISPFFFDNILIVK